jgi:hypothetical protein
VPRHQSETVHQQFGAVCGNDFSNRFSFLSISDMVNTRSSHPLQPLPSQPPPSAPGASNDPDLGDFLKSMTESMEVLRKQNEELNARLTAAEARSSEKERERAERREKDKRDRIRRGKRPLNPQGDNESTVQGENEEDISKSRRVEEGSRRGRSRREESTHGESRREGREGEKPREGERSHRSR